MATQLHSITNTGNVDGWIIGCDEIQIGPIPGCLRLSQQRHLTGMRHYGLTRKGVSLGQQPLAEVFHRNRCQVGIDLQSAKFQPSVRKAQGMSCCRQSGLRQQGGIPKKLKNLGSVGDNTMLRNVQNELRQNVCYRRGVGTEGLKGSLRQKSCYRRQHGQIDEFWDATGGVGKAAKALPRCRGRASQEAHRSGG